jgi:LPXTG-site transpeptidase (sortase) family protein
MRRLRILTLSIVLAMVLTLSGPVFNVAADGTSPTLVASQGYSVLAGAAVTNVPTTTVNGAVGVTPGTSIGGGIVAGGGIHSNDGSAIAAMAELENATTGIWGFLDQACDFTYGAVDLTTLSPLLVPGVYCSTSSFSLTGNLTLAPSGVYIFKTVSTLITSPGSSVTGGDPCNIWWRIGSSTTLGTTTSFIGTVISLNGTNAMQTNATLNGRFLALSAGTITLDQNTITGPTCGTTTTTALSAGSIAAGGTAYDTATLTGTNIGTAGGSVTYNIYSDSACTALVGTAGTRTVTGGVVPDSGPFTFSSTGTYYWRASYSGDTLHQASANACGAEVLTVARGLPATGFSPNRMTTLPVQPANKAYATMGDLWLEIPKLGVQMNIVGVPQEDGEWDVSWLGKDAGWLQGSAFPTWSGNSVLTGHVWNADNTAGLFRYINTLWWGDKVIVHAWGAQYVYEVRSIRQVSPGNTGAMLKHEELSWITLVTCRGYNEATDSYKYRVLVRAVLVEVK